MRPELVSVVVPAFDAGAHIRAALESVSAQDCGVETEILVVDDGSRDDTRDQVAAFGRARLIRQSKAGPSAARNRGIAEARGTLVAFLDADDLWTPHRLRVQLDVLKSNPEAGLVFGDCRRFSATGERSLTLFEESGLDRDYWGGQALVSDAYAKLLRLNFIPTGSVLVRKSCLERAGGFDESLRLVEDLELWLRVARHCPIAYTPALCELKREHPGGLSADGEAMALAYLRVLQIQRERCAAELRRARIRLAPLVASEHCWIGDRRERRGDLGGARRHYLAALRAYPSPRPLYYLLRSWLPLGRIGTRSRTRSPG